MRPNKRGKRPCILCARDGMRRFHDTCDPTKRAEQAKKLREIDKKAASFPPKKEGDPKYPSKSYAANACPHCKRDNTKPEFTLGHNPATCPRRPGGQCDQANADTRKSRDAVVRKFIHDKRKAADAKAAGGANKEKGVK